MEYQLRGHQPVLQVNGRRGAEHFPWRCARSCAGGRRTSSCWEKFAIWKPPTIAINASLTGHLVFSTLHTNDAPSAVTRLIDIGVKPFLVASSTRALMAQRLVRKICKRCTAPHTPTDTELTLVETSDLGTSWRVLQRS